MYPCFVGYTGIFLWATFFLLCGFGGLRYGSGVSGGSRCAYCCSAEDDGMLFQIILPQRQGVAQQVNAVRGQGRVQTAVRLRALTVALLIAPPGLSCEAATTRMLSR